MNKQELGISRRIMDLERVHMRRAGIKSLIYKRLTEGEPCSECRDIETNQVLNPQCDTCFNTGFKQGYDKPVEIYLENITAKNEQVVAKNTGEGEDDKIQYVFRHVSDPEIHQHDLIVCVHENTRYVVEKSEKFNFKGEVPLVSHITVSLLQGDHVLYNISLDHFV